MLDDSLTTESLETEPEPMVCCDRKEYRSADFSALSSSMDTQPRGTYSNGHLFPKLLRNTIGGTPGPKSTPDWPQTGTAGGKHEEPTSLLATESQTRTSHHQRGKTSKLKGFVSDATQH